MASQNSERKPREALADCTNTPTTRPQRRSCKSSAAPVKTTTRSCKVSVGIDRSQQNEDPSRANYRDLSFCTPSGTSSGGDGFWVVQDNENVGQNIKVCSAWRQNKGKNSSLSAVERFEFPDSNEDVDSQASGFHFKWREEDVLKKSSFSCPPLGRANYESPAGGRAKVRKMHSLGVSEVLPNSGRSKKRVRRRDSSGSANDGKCSLPEDFVRQQ